MTAGKPFVFRFEDVEVRERELTIIKAGGVLPVEPKAFRVLLFLLHNPQKLITKEELLDAVWADAAVTESSLTRSIAKLRRALGDDFQEPRYIATVATVGYRFVCPVEVSEDGGFGSEPAAEISPVPPHRSVRRFLVPQWMIVFGVVILAVGAGFFAYRRTSTHLTKEQRTLTRLTFDDGLQSEPTWSPDARYVAYSSDRGGKFDIWVQQVNGGNPIQVTKGPGQNWQPNWSPDGKYIAYRSEEGDGGIFVIPALGGAGLERKIATFGYHPRWSPDGAQVLFELVFTDTGSNRFYIAQLDGGPPREVLAEFLAQKKLSANAAAWYSDGKKITVWIANSTPTPGFWTIPIAGGPGIKLEIATAVQKELAQASGDSEAGQQLGEYTFSWSPSGDAIYFERGYGGARNIWKLQVDSQTMRATSIDRLTTGPGPDAGAAVSKDGKRLAFSAKSQRIQTWLFPFDSTTGQIKGDGTAITSPGRTSIAPDISRDGMNLAYVVPHGETGGSRPWDVRNEVWVKSLVDGSEAPVIADQEYSRWLPNWSPDGTRLVYERRNLKTNERQQMVWSRKTHDEEPIAAPSTLCLACDWSPDVKTAMRKIHYDRPEYGLFNTHLSPDGRWIVFNAVADSLKLESALYVIPVAGGTWTRITDGRHWDDKPRWSPDGRKIYFVSGSDGFFNVWGIRFDPATGKPVGQPFQVSKFDRPRLMIPRWIPPVGFSLTQDKFVLTMAAESGNIWVLDNVDR